MKPIISLTHKNPLLENYQSLQAETKPEKYAGFIYMWKCIPEDMFYIGSHKGIVHDDYRGSGSKFRKVFEYYGITKFERIILEYVEDPKEIKNQEQRWMNKFRAATSSRFYNQKNVVAELAV